MPSLSRSTLTGAVVALVLIFAFHYFFTERLPWFWYDDVERLEIAEQISVTKLVGQIINPMSDQFGWERPVLQLYIKTCAALFGDNPHAFRLVKLALFALALLILYYMQVANLVHPVVAAVGTTLMATFPSMIIGTAWIGDSVSLELLFLGIALALFLLLIRFYQGEGLLSWKSVGIAALLIAAVILADRTKAPAKTVPLVFLSWLVLVRSRHVFLYVVTGISLLAVIPYGLFFSSGQGGRFAGWNHLALASELTAQVWPLLACGIFTTFIGWKNGFAANRYLLLLLIWFFWEVCFFVAYPSSEIRYLYTSLAAVSMLISAFFSSAIDRVPVGHLRTVAVTVTCFLVAFVFVQNTIWADNFRGSFGAQFVLADKKMKHINTEFTGTLALYDNFAPLYFARNTGNFVVNINRRYSFDHLIKRGTDNNVYVINQEKYTQILALDESIISHRSTPQLMVFDSVLEGSFWDTVKKTIGVNSTRHISLYNTRLGDTVPYPAYSAIYSISTNK